jgi:tetratricopeptide (TPR) repeat protein
MGKVFQDKGDVQAAIREFKRIINDASPETESEVCLAFLSLGDALNEIGERGESRIAWKEAIRWDAYKIVAKKAKERLKANL